MGAKLKFLFVITGTKFYMDWLLITNPISKNPIIKFLWGWMKSAYTGSNYKKRLLFAKILFTIHFVPFVLNITLAFYLNLSYNFLIELACNIYPMIIQIYIGYRCWCVIQWKKHRRYVNNRKQSVKLSLS